MQAKTYFRNVEEKDRELLFDWANDAETRRQSFSTAPITWEEHAAWFARTQADTDCLHWMFMVCCSGVGNGGAARADTAEQVRETDGAARADTAEQVRETGGAARADTMKQVREADGRQGAARAAGVLRLAKDQADGRYRISYSIAPAWRGRGLGTELLKLAKAWAAAFCPEGAELYGEVRADNAASVRCFERAGYEKNTEKATAFRRLKTADEGKRMRDMPEASDTADVVCFHAKIPHKALIYFRADANKTIGYGHIMRCLTIADACEKQGLYPVFVTADGEAQETILTRGFPCLVLGTDYRDMEPELDKLSALLADGAPIVLDSYCITGRYAGTLRENGHRVVWMDDLGGQAYPADMLINYNMYAEQLAYSTMEKAEEGAATHPAGKANTDCVYLLGSDYAPVRPVFRRQEGMVRETIGTVLVTTGGADPYGAGVWFAELLTGLLPDARILVVCGPYAEGNAALYRLSGQNEKVTVIEGCSDLSSLMHESDLAVAAAGSTLYELCAARLPGVIYYMADNQRRGAEAFARETGTVNLGDIRADGFRKEAAVRMGTALAHLAAAPERKKLADAMHKIVDGNGAERIAQRLAKLVFTCET